MLWRIAWRNLWRHKTRTLIMTTAVALSYGLLLFSMGMGDDGHQQMLDQAAESAGGDVLVHADGFWEARSSDLVIDDGEAVARTVASVQGVGTAIPRILVSGLVSSSTGTRSVFLQGIAPEREIALRDLSSDVREGVWLPESTRDDPLVLGGTIVDKLELELGDRVVLTATDPEGEMTRALFHLTGVIRTGLPEMDELMGFTTLEAARHALDVEQVLTQVGVVVAGGETPDSVAARIERALAGRDVEVLTWLDAIPEMVGFVEVDNAFLYIYMAVIFAVVAFAIANTFLMAVMERVREFGLLSALGLRSGGVAHLVVAETVLLTAMAMAIGFVVGYSGHLAMVRWGIPVAAWGVEDVVVSGVDFADMVMRSKLNPFKWTLASILVAMITISSALYPAYRAAKLTPADAMRFYE